MDEVQVPAQLVIDRLKSQVAEQAARIAILEAQTVMLRQQLAASGGDGDE